MRALTSSCSKIFADNCRDGRFLLSRDFLGIPEIRFLKFQKHVWFSNFISLQHKTIHPIFSSSFSSESQVALEETETPNREIYQSKTVHVKFQLQKECLFGEQFLIVGDDPMLGLWDPSNAIPMEWSDGHSWTVELDIPVGKSIQFKFIMNGSTGDILWQPGPDRILSTWETTNTITVYEDWENAEFQKIIEEGLVTKQNEEPTVNSEMLIVAENLTQPKEEQITDANKTSSIADTISYPAENPVTRTQNEPIVTQNITHLQEKPMAMVAENITYPKEKPMTISIEDVMIRESTLENNGNAGIFRNPARTEDEENLVNFEGPVLVPGLTPLSTTPTIESPPNEVVRGIAVNDSVEVNDAKDHNAPEFKEGEPDCGPQQEEPTEMMFNDEEELHDRELKQKPHLAKELDQPDLETNTDNVLRNDVQWGRRTLQKVLSNLGFF